MYPVFRIFQSLRFTPFCFQTRRSMALKYLLPSVFTPQCHLCEANLSRPGHRRLPHDRQLLPDRRLLIQTSPTIPGITGLSFRVDGPPAPPEVSGSINHGWMQPGLASVPGYVDLRLLIHSAPVLVLLQPASTVSSVLSC